MPFDRATLEAAIQASGGATQPDGQVEGLLAKLQFLEGTGRYGTLLKGIGAANNKSNFLALILEATFADQFERAGLTLGYEVKQLPGQTSSIDFSMKLPSGELAYFELRLLQQDAATTANIAKQLAKTGAFGVLKDGADEQAEVFKVQSTILGKVENKDGKAIKFLKVDESTINIVAICISDILLGTADLYDCLLATYGDPEVPEHCRRQVFGMFQEAKAEYPAHIHQAAVRFAHFRTTVHAVLFLFKPPNSGVLDYRLQQVLVWNRGLIAAERAQPVCEQVFAAVGHLGEPRTC